MTLSCAIIDDEPLALDLLESYVRKTPFLSLEGKYSSAVLALGALKTKPVDLVFLDIQMPELNGLEFSRMISPETRIVFTTAFGQYAIEGYKVSALDYLLKPISYPDFLEAAGRALQWFSRNEDNNYIFVKSDYKMLRIRLADIRYIEGLKDYIKIYSDEFEYPVLTLMTMKAIEEMLPPSRFMRVHRSFIVNKDKIKVVERGRIVFGDTYIPVGDSYRQAFQSFIDNKG